MIVMRELGDNDTRAYFNLTPQEMREAYYEQQHLFDMEDVRNWLEMRVDMEDEERQELYRHILGNEDALNYVVCMYRCAFDKNSDEYESFVETAVHEYALEKGDK